MAAQGHAISEMRRATNAIHMVAHEPPEVRKKKIVAKRGCFKWMPVYFSNDLVHGSWYYVVGSALTAIIPLFPLISLYQGFWPKSGYLPLAENAAAYILLAIMGVFYTIGSFAFLRAVEEPRPPPLFTWYHFSTDELFAMWMFAAGTVPSVPVMGLYVIFNPDDGPFFLALLLCIGFSIASIVAALCCYPTEKPHQVTKYLSTLICAHCCENSCYGRHLGNDWLIVCWGVVWGCAMACVMSLGLLLYEANRHYRRGIFDYATGLFDCVLFLIGSMYIVAGSYADEELHSEDIESTNNDNNHSGNEMTSIKLNSSSDNADTTNKNDDTSTQNVLLK